MMLWYILYDVIYFDPQRISFACTQVHGIVKPPKWLCGVPSQGFPIHPPKLIQVWPQPCQSEPKPQPQPQPKPQPEPSQCQPQRQSGECEPQSAAMYELHVRCWPGLELWVFCSTFPCTCNAGTLYKLLVWEDTACAASRRKSRSKCWDDACGLGYGISSFWAWGRRLEKKLTNVTELLWNWIDGGLFCPPPPLSHQRVVFGGSQKVGGERCTQWK